MTQELQDFVGAQTPRDSEFASLNKGDYMFGYRGAREPMNPAAVAAEDPGVMSKYPAWAAQHKFIPGHETTEVPYRIGEWLNNKSINQTTPMFSGGAWPSAGRTGAILGGTGLLGTWLLNRFKDPEQRVSPMLMGTLGLLAGAGIGGLAGKYTEKYASFFTPPGTSDTTRRAMLDAIAKDFTMDPRTRESVIKAIMALSESQVNVLRGQLGWLGGAGVGWAVAKWLMGRGLLGQLGGAILGGAIGSAFFGPSTPVNGLGFPSTGHRDYNGNPILI
jgi:hypothetical protein